ncbi:MAG: hypothetical protein QM655_09090 [Nocardioidaceae bacterium]
MSQLRVELRRYRSRRAIAVLLLLGALVAAWLTIDTVWSTREASDTDVAGAKQSAADAQATADADYRNCLKNPSTLRPDATAADCVRAQVDYRDYLKRAPLSPREELRDSGQVAALTLAALGFVIGAVFAGADWASGAMRTQVIAAPARGRLWVVKGAAVAVAAAISSALVLGLMWATYLGTMNERGNPVSAALAGDIGWWYARAVLLVVGAALGGYALAMLLRSVLGTVALLGIYAVVGEALVGTLPISKVASASPASNVIAWLRDGVRVFDPTIECPAGGGACTRTYELTLASGATYLGALLALVLLISWLAFRRRDIA